MIDDTAMVHPMACVAESEIGARTKVWQFASVIRGAVVGSDCTIASGTLVDGSRVGDRSIVGHNATLVPGAVIGQDVFIGPAATLCNDLWPRAEKAGFSGFICALAHANDAMRKRTAAIVIEDGASVGAGAVLVPGIVIGEKAMVAAGAVVTRNVPSHHLWRDGNAKPISPDLERFRLETRMRLANCRDAALDA